MPVEGERLVLGQNVNPPQFRVETVRQSDVDDAIDPAKGYGRFSAVAGERVEAFSCSSR
jgi:hypothetical protein